MRIRTQRNVQRHDVARPQQYVEGDVIGRGCGQAAVRQDTGPKTPQPVHDRRADAPRSDHPDGQIAQLSAAHLVQPVVVQVRAADGGFRIAHRHQHEHQGVVGHAVGSRRRSRRRCRYAPRSPRRCDCSRCSGWICTSPRLGGARRRTAGVTGALCPTLMHRFPEANSALPSDTAASVRVAVTPKRGASCRDRSAWRPQPYTVIPVVGRAEEIDGAEEAGVAGEKVMSPVKATWCCRRVCASISRRYITDR
ncbi:hypothetical protein STENM327S_05547 [Streptomyces tendae]